MLIRPGIIEHEFVPTSAPGAGGWTRPVDWLALPDVVEGDEKFVGLYAVYDYDSNFVALRCRGDYTVDWGDGTIENVADNVTAQHVYDSDDYNTLGKDTECSRGYRQAIITVTPQAGKHLTSLSLNYKHSQAGLGDYRSQWLDVKLAGALLSSIIIGANSTMLEQCHIVGDLSITSAVSMFENCYSLQSLPLWDTSSVTNMRSMCRNCRSIQSLPLWDTSSVTDMSYMCNSCSSLQSLPAFSVANVTDFTDWVTTCPSLGAAPLSGPVVNISFANCKLARDEIVAIFQGLGTVTGKTVTITGNWGIAALSEADRDIARNKGWTIAE